MSSNAFDEYMKKKDSLQEELLKPVEERKSGFSTDSDDRMFRFVLTKEGNTYVLLRFLPWGVNIPWVSKPYHSFKHNGKKFWINCPTGLGRDCPMCNKNVEDWDSASEDYREKVLKQRTRKWDYFANIYVVDDKNNPDNNGKVLVWKFGRDVFNKIDKMLHPKPKFENDKPKGSNVFDPFVGNNFELVTYRNEMGYLKYDDSKFLETTPISEDQNKVKELFEKCHDLNEFVDPKFFPSDETINKRMNFVFKNVGSNYTSYDKNEEKTVENTGENSKVMTPSPFVSEEKTVEKNVNSNKDEKVEKTLEENDKKKTFFQDLT